MMYPRASGLVDASFKLYGSIGRAPSLARARSSCTTKAGCSSHCGCKVGSLVHSRGKFDHANAVSRANDPVSGLRRPRSLAAQARHMHTSVSCRNSFLLRKAANSNFAGKFYPNDRKRSLSVSARHMQASDGDNWNESQTKVERMLKILREEVAWQAQEQKIMKNVEDISAVQTKKRLRTRIYDAVVHTWHSLVLFCVNVKSSWRLTHRVLRGDQLTRAEYRHLTRTVSDLFRMVPFSMFILIPAAEVLLPVFLYLFPNMLPSTFKDAIQEEEKIRRLLKVKIEMANFLKDALKEMSLEVVKGNAGSGCMKKSRAEEFTKFMETLKSEDEDRMFVSNELLLKFVDLFEDELTLDKLNMTQLRALCRILQINFTVYSPATMRFQLGLKLRELRADDRMIAAEGGVTALSVSELQEACRARGMRALGLSENRLQQQLGEWLELSLNDKVPASLLLMSRAFYFPEEVKYIDRLKAIIGRLPDTIANEARLRLTEIEGGTVSYKDKIEFISSLEAAISQERAVSEAARRLKDELDEQQREEELAKASHRQLSTQFEVGVAKTVIEQIQKMQPPDAADSAASAARQESSAAAPPAGIDSDVLAETARILSKNQMHMERRTAVGADDTPLTGDVIKTVRSALDAESKPLADEKSEVQEIIKELSERANDVAEIKFLTESRRVNGIDKVKEPKVAKGLAKHVQKLLKEIEKNVGKLEGRRKKLSECPKSEARHRVTISRLLDTLQKMHNVEDERTLSQIVHVLQALDDDKDGLINIDLARDVIELLATHKQLQSTTPQDIVRLLKVMRREDELERMQDRHEALQAMAAQFGLPKDFFAHYAKPVDGRDDGLTVC